MAEPSDRVTKLPLLLLVDDDEAIRAYLQTSLDGRFRCESATTGEQALTLAASLRPDLVLLDLGLPDLDGMEVLRRLRLQGATPVVVVSARGRETDKVLALEAGADDYLTKPFGDGELQARLTAVLRRARAAVGPAEEPLVFGSLRWDRRQRRVFVAGEEAHLTPLEYRLFGALALRPGQVLTHAWLLGEVWGRQGTEMLHYVRIAVAGLRKKLEPHPGSQRVLHTEVGVGYRFWT